MNAPLKPNQTILLGDRVCKIVGHNVINNNKLINYVEGNFKYFIPSEIENQYSILYGQKIINVGLFWSDIYKCYGYITVLINRWGITPKRWIVYIHYVMMGEKIIPLGITPLNTEGFYPNSFYHRENGPAYYGFIVDSTGYEKMTGYSFCLCGIWLSEKEYEDRSLTLSTK